MTMIAHAFLQSRRLKQAKREKKKQGPATAANPSSDPDSHHRQARTAASEAMSTLQQMACS
ncbi:hypothetical protein EJV44_22775 [Ancylobacter aquaticus]|nr:hypothetical protein EJV44_22775 [Ancylobacter aquaticus]